MVLRASRPTATLKLVGVSVTPGCRVSMSCIGFTTTPIYTPTPIPGIPTSLRQCKCATASTSVGVCGTLRLTLVVNRGTDRWSSNSLGSDFPVAREGWVMCVEGSPARLPTLNAGGERRAAVVVFSGRVVWQEAAD